MDLFYNLFYEHFSRSDFQHRDSNLYLMDKQKPYGLEQHEGE